MSWVASIFWKKTNLHSVANSHYIIRTIRQTAKVWLDYSSKVGRLVQLEAPSLTLYCTMYSRLKINCFYKNKTTLFVALFVYLESLAICTNDAVWNNAKITVTSMRRFGMFSHDGLSSIKYVAVKTLIEKTTHYPNQKAPLPNLGNLPQVGNQ